MIYRDDAIPYLVPSFQIFIIGTKSHKYFTKLLKRNGAKDLIDKSFIYYLDGQKTVIFFQMIHFKSIGEYTKHWGLPAPNHPLFLPSRLSMDVVKSAYKKINQTPITNNYYVITFRNIISGSVNYGRTKYDGSTGTLFFLAPNQTIELHDVKLGDGGFSLFFDKNYFVGHELFTSFSKFQFFDYASNEALHLSPTEEQTLQGVFDNIEAEYINSSDEFSREIITSHVETFLKYSKRFYKRQFLDRGPINKGLFQRFSELLDLYAAENKLLESGPPKIQWLADKLAVSKRYLSDSIKTETGKTAKDQINIFLVDRAKNILLSPGTSISETAYKLGFEYPHYFTQVFKKKTGMSPKEYIEKNASS